MHLFFFLCLLGQQFKQELVFIYNKTVQVLKIGGLRLLSSEEVRDCDGR